MLDSRIPQEIPLRYLPAPSRTFWGVLAVLFVVGAGAFVLTLGGDPDRAWRAYLSNWLFFTSIAQGAIMLVVAATIARGGWIWSVRRIGQSFIAFLPFAFLLFLPLLLAGDRIFPWIHEMAHDPVLQRKEAYLNMPFLVVRNVVGLLVLFGLSAYFVYVSVRPDLGLAREEAGGRFDVGAGAGGGDDALHGLLTRGWRGQEKEEVRSHRRLARLGPILALVYAVVFSILAFDWIMSLEPHWLSTLVGAWFFMGAFWGGIAVTALTVVILCGRHGLEECVREPQLHDLGKLAFAFSVFWAYLFWSQYLVIWYGKLPWEQAFVVNRSVEPWGVFGVLVLVLCFVIPFAGLLGRKPKTMPVTLGLFTGVILVGLWLERFLLVAPSLYHGQGAPFNGVEAVIGLAFVSLLVGSVRWFLTRFPLIQIWQPMVEDVEDVVGEAEALEPPGVAPRGEED